MNNVDFKVKKIEKENKNEIELQVDGPQSLSDKAYAIALRDLSNNVDIPGFRKGKAPKDMLESKIGVGYISQRAFESIFYDVLIDVALQEKIDIVDVIQVQSFELLPGKPFNLSVVVEVKPEVKLGKYKDLKVTAKKIAYDAVIFKKKTLDKISANLISFNKVDRPVQEGDLVTIDFISKFEDGTEVPGGKSENFQALLEKDKFLPEIVEQLKGSKIGEIKDVLVTFPETSGESFASKKAVFNITLKGIEEKITPAIDDELAKKVGLENLSALETKIDEQMKSMEEDANKKELENKLVDLIIDGATFDISQRMISKEAENLLKDLKTQCTNNGIEWDSFKNDTANKEIFQKANEAAIKRISIDLILGAVIKDEKITVSKEEVDSEVQVKVLSFGEKYKYLENDSRFRNNVELVMLRNKAVDFLLKNNTPDWDKEVTIITPD